MTVSHDDDRLDGRRRPLVLLVFLLPLPVLYTFSALTSGPALGAAIGLVVVLLMTGSLGIQDGYVVRWRDNRLEHGRWFWGRPLRVSSIDLRKIRAVRSIKEMVIAWNLQEATDIALSTWVEITGDFPALRLQDEKTQDDDSPKFAHETWASEEDESEAGPSRSLCEQLSERLRVPRLDDEKHLHKSDMNRVSSQATHATLRLRYEPGFSGQERAVAGFLGVFAAAAFIGAISLGVLKQSWIGGFVFLPTSLVAAGVGAKLWRSSRSEITLDRARRQIDGRGTPRAAWSGVPEKILIVQKERMIKQQRGRPGRESVYTLYLATDETTTAIASKIAHPATAKELASILSDWFEVPTEHLSHEEHMKRVSAARA